MRLTVKVLPLKQGPDSSLTYGSALSRGPPAAQFALPIDPDTTIDEIWRRIEARYTRNYLTEQQARVFKIKKLKDAYGSDLDVDDIARALFADESPEKRVIQVEQEYFGREVSIPPTSNLRPQVWNRKRAAEPNDHHIYKRVRTNGGKHGHLDQLPPIPNSQFDDIFPAPVVTSIGEISGVVSQDQVIADSHPSNAHVNGFSDASAAKSESLEVSPAQLHTIPESNNSSVRGSQLLGEENALPSARTEEEGDPDEITTPGSSNGSSFENSSRISETGPGSHQACNSNEDHVLGLPDKSTTRNSTEMLNPNQIPIRTHSAQSAISTPQPFPSSTPKPSENVHAHGENLLGTRNVQRILSFSPRPNARKGSLMPISKANHDGVSNDERQVTERGSVYSISSGRSSRSLSEDIALNQSLSKPTSDKTQKSNEPTDSVARLERVEVPTPLSPISPSEVPRPGTADRANKQHPGSTDRHASAKVSERSVQSSALKQASKPWTEDETEILLTACKSGRNFEEIANDLLPSRTAKACNGKYRRIIQDANASTHNESNRGTESIVDIQSEANEADSISAQITNENSRGFNLIASKGKDPGRSKKETSSGNLSQPRQRDIHIEAPPSSDNGRDNPILIPDPEPSNPEEDGEEEDGDEDDADTNNGNLNVVKQNDTNAASTRKSIDKSKNETPPISSSNMKIAAAKMSQTHLKHMFQPGKREGNRLERSQPQSSQKDESQRYSDKAKKAKLKSMHGKRNDERRDELKGSESKKKISNVHNVDSLSNKSKPKKPGQDKQEANVNHILEDELQNQLRQDHNTLKSPSDSPSREASLGTDYIASSPPGIMPSGQPRPTILKQPSSKKTATPMSTWLTKGDTGSSKALRDKFNELKKTSPGHERKSDFLQSRLPTYTKLSSISDSGFLSNSINVPRDGKDNDSDASKISSRRSSDDDDDEDENNDSISESEDESDSSSSSSSSSSDTNEKTATQVWQKEATSHQAKDEPNSSNRYSRLAKISMQFKRPKN